MTQHSIPGPPGRPLIGNAWDIDIENPMKSLCSLTSTYGPIWKFCLGGEERIVIGSQALMDEVCDEGRFSKIVAASLKQARNGVHDGLGTAYGPEERNWGIAHRILAPHFGPLSIRGMFDEMHDIASQLVMKWGRHGPEHAIQVVDDFTRLTLDTIALCAMDYRFNSYYSESMHPFVEAMAGFFKTSGDRARRNFATQLLLVSENHKYWSNIELLRKTGLAVINARKEQPNDKKDLLNGMLYGIDPETGEKMTDDNVIDNMITFLIVGHETTSGLLSFTFYYLLNNRSAYVKAQQEVDEVIGRDPITVDHLSRLPYLNAVLRESLRLSPTAPSIALAAKKNTTLGGKYNVKANTPIIALFAAIHRDSTVYGNDADEFRPDRMLEDSFNRRNDQFPNCWKPFGNGMRACIGRSFAWQQALLIVAMLLQNFTFTADDPTYRLKVKQTLTIKPEGFRMRARLRHRMYLPTLERTLSSSPMPSKTMKPATGALVNIYYASNTGTCENLARQLADHAADHGFAAGVVGPLDHAKESLSVVSPTVIIAASYDGQPASNAAHFVDWIRSLQDVELTNVVYSVFGCGHRDWAKTLFKVPKYIDCVLEERGGTRLTAVGTSDVAQSKVSSDFAVWETHTFWPAMRKRYVVGFQCPSQESLQVDVSIPQSPILTHNLHEAVVVAVEVLSSCRETVTGHLEIKMPPGMTHSAGDCIAVLPRNPKQVVRRTLKHFGLSQDSILTISSAAPTLLPTDTPVSAAEVFGAYVELTQPASQPDILVLLDATRDEGTKIELAHLSGEAYEDDVVAKHVSVLDLLETFPAIQLSISIFLSMQPPMRVRHYCISSSPLWNPNRITVTYSIASYAIARGQKHAIGVGSRYLASLTVGDEAYVRVKALSEVFHLPEDVESIPLIMVAAGIGLAPFRGFIQERAAQLAAGRSLAPALLFYGCHSPDDFPYAETFNRWQQLGAVDLRLAFSHAPERSQGCRYLQDRIYQDKNNTIELLEAGAKLAVCVSENIGDEIRRVLLDIAKERMTENPEGRPGEEWLEGAWHTWESPRELLTYE